MGMGPVASRWRSVLPSVKYICDYKKTSSEPPDEIFWIRPCTYICNKEDVVIMACERLIIRIYCHCVANSHLGVFYNDLYLP